MRIAVVTCRYPSTSQPYAHMFVHARSRAYLRAGHNVKAFVPAVRPFHYAYDGVSVNGLSTREICRELEWADAIMIHLVYHDPRRAMNGGPIYSYIEQRLVPCLFFLHGIEVQSIWSRRRDDIQPFNPRSVARWIFQDCYRLPRMMDTINALSSSGNVRFVAPSRWMLAEAEDQTGVDLKKFSAVIPNGIDTEFFDFRGMPVLHRNRVLSIRPLFRTGKYGVDLALNAFQGPVGDCSLTLVGDGPNASEIQRWISRNRAAKIDLRVGFHHREGIRSLHREHGIYFAPTRMDAQGVSMCEAMSSGMPVVTFDVCAIPEFVRDGVSGIVRPIEDLQGARDAIKRLSEDRDHFEHLSLGARASAESIDIHRTTNSEVELVQGIG